MTNLGKHAKALVEYDRSESYVQQLQKQVDRHIANREPIALRLTFGQLHLAHKALGWAQLELNRAIERIRPSVD